MNIVQKIELALFIYFNCDFLFQGSGKTLAFGIPILHHILNFKEQQNAEASPDCDTVDDSVSEDIADSEFVDCDHSSDSGLEVQQESETEQEASDSETDEGNTVIDLNDLPIPTRTAADGSDDSDQVDNPPEEEETLETEVFYHNTFITLSPYLQIPDMCFDNDFMSGNSMCCHKVLAPNNYKITLIYYACPVVSF